jgi:hypothetical protein
MFILYHSTFNTPIHIVVDKITAVYASEYPKCNAAIETESGTDGDFNVIETIEEVLTKIKLSKVKEITTLSGSKFSFQGTD